MTKPKHPKEGEHVLLRLRGRTKATDGKRSFWQPWQECVVSAWWHEKPFASESGHFRGKFNVADRDVQYHEVELIEWVGFSGGGKA